MDLDSPSKFRLWVQRLWMENREERLTYDLEPATIKHYWHSHKWWIKREYKHRKKINEQR